MLRSLLLAAALAGLAAALDFRTIVGYVDSEPQLSTLAGLLRDAHLDLVLEAPGAIFTLFAPTNDAFSSMAADVLDRIKHDPVLLQKVLMIHALDKVFLSLSMSNELLEDTLSGEQLRFNIYNRTYTAGGAPITTGDVVVRNGVIHIIDGVILPSEGDILRQIMTDDEEFEDLTAALAVTNLLRDLSLESITLFAPLNSALRNYYNFTGLPNDMAQVKEMLLNHIVNGTYYTAGLHDGDTLTTLSGHILNINKSPSGVLSVNGHQTDGDIYASNGIIHRMTSVLSTTGS